MLQTELILVGHIKPYDVKLIGRVSVPMIVREDSYEDYEGSYVIVPSFSEQVMDVQDKHMTSDVTIESIPYSEVSNESGGFTINIGG